MTELVFFLEEVSALEMLQGLLPKLVPESITLRYVVFEGKQDLIKQLQKRLLGYLVPDAYFVVLCDKDAGECVELKARLVNECKQAGKSGYVVRIACHEIESWYLADLLAVEAALSLKKLSLKQNLAKFRNPDLLANASDELMRLTDGQYQKVSGSRTIGPFLNVDNTRSNSFRVFVEGIRHAVSIHDVQPSS
jgi:hypothetical protein